MGVSGAQDEPIRSGIGRRVRTRPNSKRLSTRCRMIWTCGERLTAFVEFRPVRLVSIFGLMHLICLLTFSGSRHEIAHGS
ncbi:MAG: hypothetical protein ACRCYU_06500 [Nocardioides sp.]